MNLENAPLEIQVAIDLIYLLEINQIRPTTALKALDIVKKIMRIKKPSHHLPMQLKNVDINNPIIILQHY